MAQYFPLKQTVLTAFRDNAAYWSPVRGGLGAVNIPDVPAALAVGVVASLIAAAIGWFFRGQLLASMASLDMSAGAILAWLMVFVMLLVVIVFAWNGTEIPLVFYVLLPTMTSFLLVATVNRRR